MYITINNKVYKGLSLDEISEAKKNITYDIVEYDPTTNTYGFLEILPIKEVPDTYEDRVLYHEMDFFNPIEILYPYWYVKLDGHPLKVLNAKEFRHKDGRISYMYSTMIRQLAVAIMVVDYLRELKSRVHILKKKCKVAIQVRLIQYQLMSTKQIILLSDLPTIIPGAVDHFDEAFVKEMINDFTQVVVKLSKELNIIKK